MKFTSTLFFVQQYGLLGFMVEAPVNPNFLLDKEVILKEDNFISKKCVMKAQDYFDLFFSRTTKVCSVFTMRKELIFKVVNDYICICFRLIYHFYECGCQIVWQIIIPCWDIESVGYAITLKGYCQVINHSSSPFLSSTLKIKTRSFWVHDTFYVPLSIETAVVGFAY